MTLTIYGDVDSRTMRVFWAAHELGLDFENVPYHFDDPRLKQTDFLAINPAGTIPAIDDGGVQLGESLAIVLYLAKKYGGPPFYPATLEGEAQVWRWALWAQGHLEPWVQGGLQWKDVMAQIRVLADPILERACALLEMTLADRDWLLGDDFSAADLAVAAVLSPSRAVKLPLERFPRILDWHIRCYDRPAAVKTRGGPSPLKPPPRSP